MDGRSNTPDCLPAHLQEKSSRVGVLTAKESVELAVARLIRETLTARPVQETLAQKCGNIYYQVQAAVDRVLLREVLEHVKGNQVEAADVLGISRNTLRSKLRYLKMVVEKQVHEAPD